MKQWMLAVLVVAALATAGCSEDYKTQRGRGDAPVGPADDSPGEIINFPDGYPNVATKCNHGHRIYVSTKVSDKAIQMTIVEDPSCKDHAE